MVAVLVAATGPKIDQCSIEWEYSWDAISTGTIYGGCAGWSVTRWPKNRSILYTSGYIWDIVSVGIVNGGCAGGHGDQK